MCFCRIIFQRHDCVFTKEALYKNVCDLRHDHTRSVPKSLTHFYLEPR